MPSISRDELLKALKKDKLSSKQKEITNLRLAYSNIHTLRDTVIHSLRGKDRISPTILPTQSSGRWSYIDPSLNNFPKKCINPACPKGVHEKTVQCWSSRDCIQPDKDTFWIEHDLDAVEHKIYCLILNWEERLNDLRNGFDIHTPVTCTLFNLPNPHDTKNPHSLCTCTIDRVFLQEVCEHCKWREQVKWNGKDDARRTISKNMTYGGQYFYVSIDRYGKYKAKYPYRVYKRLIYNPTFVYTIPNIESFLIRDEKLGDPVYDYMVPPNYIDIAIKFVEDNIEIQSRKAIEMEKIRKDKIARTLYGNRRLFYFTNQSTAKEGFNFRIQGTVASYINESCILLQKEFPDSYLVQNQHDSLKWAFRYQSFTEQSRKDEEEQILQIVKDITQRELIYNNNSINITATFHIRNRSEG